MIYYRTGSERTVLSADDLRNAVSDTLDRLGPRRKVLVIPPDFTRFHSHAGEITGLVYRYYGNALKAILPALGTHTPMTPGQLVTMFPGIPASLFLVHNWRQEVVTLGRLSDSFVAEITGGSLRFDWPAQLNRTVCEGGYDLILSVGQVVPHEVAGMAGYNKNLFIGTGGAEGIHKSHYIGAVYGMERLMGKTDNPVRKLLNQASQRFLSHLPVVYLQTVVEGGRDAKTVIRGFFAGDDEEVFTLAAALSAKVNINLAENAFKKAVVYLDPMEYRSTWLGNKAIYRTRMALGDNAELIILGPGVREFGEDREIDRLIRKYGYNGRSEILRMAESNEDLKKNLGVAAHLIHGSTEGRFTVTWCPGLLSREEIEKAGYCYADPAQMMSRYDPAKLKEGYNTLAGGEEIFYISNPALGLWASTQKFQTSRVL